MKRRKRSCFGGGVLWILAAGCQKEPGEGPGTRFVVVESRPDDGLDLSEARVDGPVRKATLLGGRLVIELAKPAAVVVKANGACPLTVDARAPGTTRALLLPWLEFAGAGPELGFDRPFSIEAKAGCPESRTTKVEWRQVSGAPLPDFHVDADGRRVTGRTAPFPSRPFGSWGIVPLSPRTRGEAELVATYSADGAPHSRTLRLAAAARSRGLPNVATGTRLYLSKHDFRVISAPEHARAEVEASSFASSLQPDVGGAWVLGDGSGRTLRLVAGRYDETPLDCTRADCHAELDSASRGNPMTTVLQRGLDTRFGPEYPMCAAGCHMAGEPGLDDGGFFSVASALGIGRTELGSSDWHGLPPALRRLGGVGCLSCHGPGAIPEATARYAILRSDVCATCHDAPPRYGHVAAWQSSAMSRADADPRIAGNAACARCHTTWGFLGSDARRPPEDAGPIGISCAACHSVHPHGGGGSPAPGRCEEALARQRQTPALLAGATPSGSTRGQICLPCHTPSVEEGTPSATAAALWLGRGGLNPEDGEALNGPALASAEAADCLACHHDGPANLDHGAGHAFVARRTASDPGVARRARALWERLSAADGKPAEGGPPHALERRIDRSTKEGRARWNVALVLEDPAADVHNPAYAGRLLDAAEAAIGSRSGDGR